MSSFTKDEYDRLIRYARELHRLGYDQPKTNWHKTSDRVCEIARDIFKMCEEVRGQQYPLENADKFL